MTEIITGSPAATEAFAETVARRFTGGEIIAFKGGLGMGKTCFTRGIARGLDYEGQVTSPTFALVNEYLGGRLPLYHFDMYRIESWEDLYSSGFFDYAEQGGVIAAEWSENIEGALEDRDVIRVQIEYINDDTRRILLEGGGY